MADVENYVLKSVLIDCVHIVCCVLKSELIFSYIADVATCVLFTFLCESIRQVAFVVGEK